MMRFARVLWWLLFVSFCLLYTNRRTEECGNFLREASRQISQTSHLPFLWHFQYLQKKNFAAFFHALESSKLFMYQSQGGDQRWCEQLHRYLQWFQNPKIGKKGWFYFVGPVPIDFHEPITLLLSTNLQAGPKFPNAKPGSIGSHHG